MQPRTVAPVLLALVAMCLPCGGAAAREAPAAVEDPRGDVRIYTSVTGLTRAQRTSIDLRRVIITPRASSVRITVRMKAVPRRMPVDQMVFLALAPAPGSSGTGRGDIGLSPQKPGLSYAALDTDGTGTSWESCDPMRVEVRRPAGEVRLDVPLRCIPVGEVTVEVRSLTGYFRSDSARPWSSDRVRFPDPVVMR
ncbi:hypothetical protein EUA93_19345 [Nocardioides oleivorans]|uniref:Uncharacterized protein n=1 Tax=Nocardioides oleivorans TaxID=273676 RepID=A0A4Q2RT29_9ACTN|nr:hypothetical protein [Nocardioides oleivorans]RYB91084.1 hypothetical protein EUA93_19345 [Nocardioides oleivorans]